MPNYMLIFRDEAFDHSGYSEDDFEALLGEFVAWTQGIAAKGQLKDVRKLNTTSGQTVRMRNGALVLDGPFAEAKETINGYLLVEAANLEAAFAIAEKCPTLALGSSVEVREEDSFPPVD